MTSNNQLKHRYRITKLRTVSTRNKIRRKKVAKASRNLAAAAAAATAVLHPSPSDNVQPVRKTRKIRTRDRGIQCIRCNLCGNLGHAFHCPEIFHPDIRPPCMDCPQCVLSYDMIEGRIGLAVRILFCTAHAPLESTSAPGSPLAVVRHDTPTLATPPRARLHNATVIAAHPSSNSVAVQLDQQAANVPVTSDITQWTESYNKIKLDVLSDGMKLKDALKKRTLPPRAFERRRPAVELYLISPTVYKKLEDDMLKTCKKINIGQLNLICTAALKKSNISDDKRRAVANGLVFS